MEIKSIGNGENTLIASEMKRHEIDGITDRLSVGEMPYIDRNEVDNNKYDIADSEREKGELPSICGDVWAEETHSPMLTAMIQESKEVYAPSMEVQAERIKEIYDATPELHYNKWKSLDINERKTVLNNFEREIATIEKRPSVPVEYERMSNGVMGYNDGRKLVVSEKVMNSNNYADYKETLNTLFHEGRHSYQNYNLDVKRTERSDEAFKAWEINRKELGYISGNLAFPFNLNEAFRQKCFNKYYTQPVEVDARLFAEIVEKKIGLNERDIYD